MLFLKEKKGYVRCWRAGVLTKLNLIAFFFAFLSSVFMGITFITKELKYQLLVSSDTKADAYIL